MTSSTSYEPQPRWGHTSVTIGDRVFMWGGRIDDFSDSAKKALSSKVDIFHIGTERWEKKRTKGKPPLGLYNNAFTAIGEDIYVYGGWDGQAAHNTLHKFNTVNLTWQEMKSEGGDDTPMKMSGCGLVAKGTDELVLFGGYGVPTAPTTAQKQKGKNVSLLTTTTSNSGRNSRQSKESSSRRGSGALSAKSSQSQEDSGGSGLTPSGSGKMSSEERRRRRMEKAKRERGSREGRRSRSSKGSRQSVKSEEEGKMDGHVMANNHLMSGEESVSCSDSSPTSPEVPPKEKSVCFAEGSGDSNLTNGVKHEEGKKNSGDKDGSDERKVNGDETKVSGDKGKGGGDEEMINGGMEEVNHRGNGEVSGSEREKSVSRDPEVMTVKVEIHDQQDNISNKSEDKKKKLILSEEEDKVEKKEKSMEGKGSLVNGDLEKEVKNKENRSGSTKENTSQISEEPIRNGVDPPITASSVEAHEMAKTDGDGKPVENVGGLSAEEKLGQGEITVATDTRPASQAEREDALTVVGEVLTVMGAGQEAEREGNEEEVVVINKKWTNELKVYNIATGKWTAPEVGGDCPPPCVDFSFDSIDDGHRAVLFGGYRPESGASSGAFLLDMETWTWTDLGDHVTSSKKRIPWPVARDGHTSCTLAGLPHPHVLVSGGWDQDNKLLQDLWILDLHTVTWKKVTAPEKVGPRLWHRVVSRNTSANLWDLIFFGGCPGIPEDVSAMGGFSWPKLNSTVLLELGRMKSPVPVSSASMRRSSMSSPKYDWVILDSLSLDQMGKDKARSKEALLFTKYRAAQAEMRAKKAEKLAQEALKKLNELLVMVQAGSFSISSSPPPLLSQLESGVSTPTTLYTTPREDKPFWIIPRNDVQITLEEVGRGRWSTVRVAHYKGQRVAARCLQNQIVSESNRKLFQDTLDLTAKMRHPNILPFIGAVLEGEPMILTELMPTNLKRVMDVEKLQNYQVAGIATDIASALYFLHTMKPEPVIYGDLTNTNVLLQKESGNMYKAKLSDFAVSKFFHAILISGSDSDRDSLFSPVFDSTPGMTGRPRSVSPPYQMSPSHIGSNEAPTNRRLPGRKTSSGHSDAQEDLTTLRPQRDVYNLGLLLVEMCTGTPPLEVSLNFLIESITWTEMTVVIKACTEYSSDLRPSMETIVNHLRRISDNVKTRPPKHALVKGMQ